MTAFSFEVPHNHLEDFADLQDFFFTLSMHTERLDYFLFHRWQVLHSPKQVWLDNSYNELKEPEEVYSLINKARNLGAHKIIVPDNPTWNEEQIFSRFRTAREYLDDTQLIVVVNSQKMRAYMLECQVQKLALSYHIRLPYYKAGGLYRDFAWAKYAHFLGMTSVAELQEIKPLTCDTSMPIKIALRGQTLKGWIEQGCPHIHTAGYLDFFEVRMTEEEIELARQNIKTLKRMVNGGDDE